MVAQKLNMLVFLCPLGQPLDIQILNTQPPRRLCRPQRYEELHPLFKKAHNFEFPPTNLTPRLGLILTQRYSQPWKMNHQGTSRDRMLRTLPRITVLNNYSPKWYREGKWHDSQRGFLHFHPIYYLKGDRALGNSIPRNSSSECQNQDQHSFIARTYKHRLELFTKWCRMVSLRSSLWRQSVKMADKYHL